jgi:hypothetical protein
MSASPIAESVLQHAIDQVEFEDSVLDQSIAELLALHPDVLQYGDGLPPPDEELRPAIAHALALAGAFLVASQKIDFLAEIRMSGLFDSSDSCPLTRFKALALDQALAAGADFAVADNEWAAHLVAVRAQVRAMVIELPGCENLSFWNSATKTP